VHHFQEREIVHLRPSGNAPESRCYNEASSPRRTAEMNRTCLAMLPNGRYSQFAGAAPPADAKRAIVEAFPSVGAYHSSLSDILSRYRGKRQVGREKFAGLNRLLVIEVAAIAHKRPAAAFPIWRPGLDDGVVHTHPVNDLAAKFGHDVEEVINRPLSNGLPTSKSKALFMSMATALL
jgi:hypothetical protein